MHQFWFACSVQLEHSRLLAFAKNHQELRRPAGANHHHLAHRLLEGEPDGRTQLQRPAAAFPDRVNLYLRRARFKDQDRPWSRAAESTRHVIRVRTQTFQLRQHFRFVVGQPRKSQVLHLSDLDETRDDLISGLKIHPGQALQLSVQLQIIDVLRFRARVPQQVEAILFRRIVDRPRHQIRQRRIAIPADVHRNDGQRPERSRRELQRRLGLRRIRRVNDIDRARIRRSKRERVPLLVQQRAGGESGRLPESGVSHAHPAELSGLELVTNPISPGRLIPHHRVQPTVPVKVARRDELERRFGYQGFAANFARRQAPRRESHHCCTVFHARFHTGQYRHGTPKLSPPQRPLSICHASPAHRKAAVMRSFSHAHLSFERFAPRTFQYHVDAVAARGLGGSAFSRITAISLPAIRENAPV